MAAKNLKEAVADVKEAHDIADYIENAGISLKQSGSRYKGLCPFHSESTPSFTVDSSFQTYHCFGCGAHGDVLSFAQEHENLSFWEALTSLAEQRGIDLSGLDSNKGADEPREDIASLREVVRATAIFFWTMYKELSEDHPAKREISKRGIPTKNRNNYYGYAPEGKNKLYQHLKSKGFSDDAIEKTGVCRKSQYGFFDAWQGRLMFIMSDITGRPVGFSGRKLYESDKMGKYVNSIDSPVFNKSSVLFNVNNAKKPARERREMFVGEGQFDVDAVDYSGHPNVVASSGTAFTDRQTSQLRRLVGDNGSIVFVFDGDNAGKEAARKVFDTDPMIHNMAYVVSFDDGYDPDDYAQEHGHKALGEYLADKKNRTPITEFVLRHERTQSDISTPEGRSRYLNSAAGVLAKVSSAPLRREYAKLVSLDAGGVPLETVEDAIKSAAQSPSARRNAGDNDDSADNREASQSLSQERRKLLEGSGEERDGDQGNAGPTVEDMVDIISESAYHQMFARLLWIAMARRDLAMDSVASVKKALAPRMFHRMIDELREYPEDTPLITERFTDQALMEHVIAEHKPSAFFVSSDDEMVEELTGIIIKQVASLRVSQRTQEKRAQLVPLLNDSDSSAEVFKRVLEEQRKNHEQVADFLKHITEKSVLKK